MLDPWLRYVHLARPLEVIQGKRVSARPFNGGARVLWSRGRALENPRTERREGLERFELVERAEKGWDVRPLGQFYWLWSDQESWSGCVHAIMG